MKKPLSKSEHTNPFSVKYFHARLMSRLVVIFISVTLAAQRLAAAYSDSDLSTSANILILSLPILAALCITVFIEYLIYRRHGLRVLKYTQITDIIFLLAFTADWMIVINIQFSKPTEGPDCHPSSGYLIFVSFAWRTLLQTLITQHWQLQSMPPLCAQIYTIWYAVNHEPTQIPFLLSRGIMQALYVTLIFYLGHKINLQLLIGNLQQEKWLQLNEFILNNLPEKIAIIDVEGNCRFVNDYFKRFMRMRSSNLSVDELFKNIRCLSHEEQLHQPDSIIIETQPIQRCDSLGSKWNNQDRQGCVALADIIKTFRKLIRADAIQEKAFQVFNEKFKPSDGAQERSLEIKISFLDMTPQTYILLIIKDMTQRDLILTLEDNNKYKDYLLASVSHELRTPLNGNINLVEAAVKSKDVSENVKEAFLVPAVKSSKFLLHLINDILDMTQIKAQKLRLIFQERNLRETLVGIVQLVEIHAKRKEISLRTEIDPFFPASFCTDHVRLSQIVLNLVHNSIKFTEKGEVKLAARGIEGTNCVQISIEDSGIGLSEEEIGRLFKDFTQIELKDRPNLNPTGVGLGLKIAYDLAKLLGPINNSGITVTSVLGHGSKFSFVIDNKGGGIYYNNERQEISGESSDLIPTELDLANEPGLEEKIAKNTSMHSYFIPTQTNIPSVATVQSCLCPKVLVVDDDPFNILAYEVILDSLGIRYECAYNGRSAIEKLLNKARYPCSENCSSFKVVFMDEEMPEMTGKEAVAEIKNLQNQDLLLDVNVIGCTAHHEGEEIEKFLRSGIKEYLPKPISKSSIQRILEKYNVNSFLV